MRRSEEMSRDPVRRQTSLLVPTLALGRAVSGLHRRHYSSAPFGVPPHITLCYPFLPPDRVDRAVVANLADLFAATSSWRSTLDRCARLPGVLSLTPALADPFIALTRGIAARFPETPAYTAPPHLSIAHGADARALDRLALGLADVLPLAVAVEDVWLMEQGADGYWRTRRRFRLGHG